MYRKGNMIPIDADRLRRFCMENGGQTTVSEKLGYGHSYISNALLTGRMNRTACKLLAATYGVPEDFFRAKEPGPPKAAQPPEPKEAQQGGYALRLHVMDKRVFLQLERDGVKVAGAYSKRKNDSDLALVQAISYAAHMIYKLCEQQALAGKS